MSPLHLSGQESQGRSARRTCIGRIAGEKDAAKLNSLGITRDDMEKLMDRLDAPGVEEQAKGASRRMAKRFGYRKASVPLVVTPSGASASAVAVVCRNISRGGLGFLHSAFMYPGTPAIAVLRHRDGADVQVPGAIIRCRHVERNVHELGMKFTSEIDVREYLPLDHLGQQFSLENVEGARLSGRVLLVADYVFDREMIMHMLRDTGVTVTVATTLEEGLKCAGEHPTDLIISDYDLGSGTGLDLLKQLRAVGVNAPLIIMSSDISATVRQSIRESQPDAFLGKPIVRAALLSAIAEFTIVGAARRVSNDGVTTALPENSPLRPMAEQFAAGLALVAPKLEQLLNENNLEEFLRLTTRIAGTATALGYAPLTQIAEHTIRTINGGMSLTEADVPARTLIGVCLRISGKKAA